MGRLVEKQSAILLTGTRSPTKDYLDRVAKYIPSEVVAAYMPIMLIITADPTDPSRIWGAWIWFGLALVFTPVYLYQFADSKSATKMHLLISCVAFIVWAYALGGPFTMAGIQKTWIAASILPAFTFIVGAYKPK